MADEASSRDDRAYRRHKQLFSKPPRIDPLDRTVHADEIVASTTRLASAVARKELPPLPVEHCPDMVPIMLKHPELWDRLSELSAFVQCADAKLPVKLRQLAILRAMWLAGGAYQWGEHVGKTRAAGYSEQDVERIKEGSSAGGWSSPDLFVLRAVEELHDDAFISDEVWDELKAHLDEPQMLELIVTVGQFTSVAYLLNSLRLTLEGQNRGFLRD